MANTRKELTDPVEGRIELVQFDKHPRINRKKRLACITKMVLKLVKLDNNDNLDDGSLSNVL